MSNLSLQWLLAYGVLGMLGCQSSLTVVDSSYYDAPAEREHAPGHGSAAARHEARPGSTAWSAQSGGWRMGVSFLTGPAADYQESIGNDPWVMIWGYQFELQYQGEPDGPTGLVEFVPMLAGLNNSELYPLANVLFGLRTPEGFEVAAGASYLSENGTGLTLAVGQTTTIRGEYRAINFAVTTNERGTRYSLTFGWNM